MLMWLFLNFFSFLAYCYLAVFVLIQNPRSSLNHACSLFNLCLALWSLQFTALCFPGISKESASLWINIGSLGWIGIGPVFLWFVLLYTKQRPRFAHPWFFLFNLGAMALLLVMQWSGQIVYVFAQVRLMWFFGFTRSVWVLLFIIYLMGTFAYSMVLLFRRSLDSRRMFHKKQAMRMLSVTLITLCLAVILSVILPLYEVTSIPQSGNLAVMIWAGWLSYVMVKQRFLSVSTAMATDNILATMSDLLILCDHKGVIVTVNQAVCDTLKCHRQQIEGQTIQRYITAQTSEDQTYLKILGRERIGNIRLHLCGPDGCVIPVMLSSSPFIDRFEEQSGTVIIARDITALIEAENALLASEKRYRELVENINDVIYTLNADGLITYMSPRIADLTGHQPEELIGKPIESITPEKDIPLVHIHMQKVMAGQPSSARCRLLKKDGGMTWAHATGRPVYEQGRVAGIQAVFMDISELMSANREKQQLREKLHQAQKMEAIGTLAGGVAHDLNNILSGIVTYPELLLMDVPDDSPLRKPLEAVKFSGQRAAAVVQDLLTLARRNVSMLEVINLNRIVTDCLATDEFREQQQGRSDVCIELHLADDLLNVKGSQVHLTKTLLHLLANAFQAFTGAGVVTITTENRYIDNLIQGYESFKSGDYTVLTVADTGCGIAARHLERIFEPFYTKKNMGHRDKGLGMAIVWGTVKDHAGYIDVSSSKGQGTTFSLYFPATRETVPDKETVRETKKITGNGEVILVVDDIPEQLLIGSSLLTKLGYKVITAAGGEAAVEVACNQSVDLLLLDMIMDPGIDGLETFSQIKKIQPDVKAVIASGFSETDRVRQALELGAVTYIKKPYTIEKIGSAIRNALEAGAGAAEDTRRDKS